MLFSYRRLAMASLSFLLLAGGLRSEEVFSQIVGVTAIDLPKQSDTLVTFPFMQSAIFRGVVESVDSENRTLNFEGSPFLESAFNSDAFSTHFVYVESGAWQGRRESIFENSTNSVKVVGLFDNLDGMAPGDIISVRPMWSFDSAFPGGIAGHEESEPGRRMIEVIIPNGINIFEDRAEAFVIFFYSNGGWRSIGEFGTIDLTIDRGGRSIFPSESMVIRNNGDTDLQHHFFGEVVSTPVAIELREFDDFSTYNLTGLPRPLPLTVDELGLQDSGVFAARDTVDGPGDLLFVYNNQGMKNPRPSGRYFYFNGAWRKEGESVALDFGSDVIGVAEAIGIRKLVAPSTQNVYWINEWELP